MKNPKPKLLVTDLDGTLIPLPEEPANQAALDLLHQELQQSKTEIAFATGRHYDSVVRAMDEFRLPNPSWLVCDVGTCVYVRSSDSGEMVVAESYRRELLQSTAGWEVQSLRRELLAIDSSLSLQEEPKQREFKLSFYTASLGMAVCVKQIENYLQQRDAPFDVIRSLDPWQDRGLIDVIPRGASKASAVAWWARQREVALEQVVYAGDSGNDLAPLAAGCCAVVVGNAEPALVAELQDVHRRHSWERRLYVADGKATSGVLEGCYWFGLFPDPSGRRPTQG